LAYLLRSVEHVSPLQRIHETLRQYCERGRTRVAKRDVARVALRVVLTLAALELVYVLAANALLRSNAVVALVQGAQGAKLDYASAYSVVPGHVHVRGVRLRFEDYNVQFQVLIDQGTLDVGLSELFFKKFHVYSLVADGVSFRMRHKSHAVGTDGERFAAYPKIEGFADPPLYRGSKPPPTPDDQYDLWQVRIDGVVAHAREVWMLEYRLQGDAEARGSFLVQPERLVVVEAALKIRAASLKVGDAPVARRVAGSVHCSVPRLDVKNTVGVAVFHSISAKLDLELHDGDLSFLNVYGAPEHEPSLSGPMSSSLRVRVSRGVVEPGSQLVLASPSLSLTWPGMTLSGALGSSFGRLRKDAGLELDSTLQQVTLRARHSALAGPKAESARLALAFAGVDLAEPIRLAEAQFVSHPRLDDLAWFDGLMGPKSRLRFSGSAEGAIELTRDARGGGAGRIELDVRRGRVRGDDLDVRSEVHAISRFQTSSAPNLSAQGAVSFRASEGETLLSLAVGPLAQRLLAAGLNLGDVSGNVAFHAAERGLELELTQAECGAVSARGHFRQPARAKSIAALLLSAGPVHVGVTHERDRTDTALVGSDWLEETWRRLQVTPPQG
jgi:hypothetical protein